jgi:hypothetical protein
LKIPNQAEELTFVLSHPQPNQSGLFNGLHPPPPIGLVSSTKW